MFLKIVAIIIILLLFFTDLKKIKNKITLKFLLK
mgnify:CR=1 FL=1